MCESLTFIKAMRHVDDIWCFLGDHLIGHFHVSIRTWPTLSLRFLNVRQWVVVVYGWSHCSLKTIESNDNVNPKLRCLARCLTKRLTHVTLSCEFLYSRGGNILRHMLNKLPLSLFSTSVKLTYFITCVQKVGALVLKVACREETHTQLV